MPGDFLYVSLINTFSTATSSGGGGSTTFVNNITNNNTYQIVTGGTTNVTQNVSSYSGPVISAGGASQGSGTVVFGNSNGVSFGLNAGTVTASFSGGAGGGAGTGFTGTNATGTLDSNGLALSVAAPGAGGGAGTNGAITGGSMTVNTSGISVNLPAYLTTAQPPGAYLTTAALSQDSSKYAGTNGAITGGSITVNTSGVSVNLPAYLTTAMASNAGSNFAGTGTSATNASVTLNSNGLAISVAPPGAGGGVAIVYSNATQTNGSLWLSGSNGITVRSGASTAIIEFDGHHMDALIPSGNGYGTGFSSMTSGTIGLSAGQGVSFSQNGNVLGMQVATNYLTTARASNDAIGLNTALTANGLSVTANSSGLSINVPAYLTTAAQSGHTHGSGPSITGSISVTSQSNAWSISIPAFLTTAQPVGAYLTTARASNDAIGLNTAATSVTWTVNSSGISLNAGAYLTTAMASNAGSNFMSTSERANYFATNANTFANSTHTHGGLTLNVTNLTTSITSASNGLTINLSAAAAGGGAAISAGTNSRSSGTVVFANSNGVTFGMDTNGSITATVVPGAAAGIAAFGGSNTTYTSGTVALTGAGAITIGSDTGQKIVVSAPATTSLAGAGGISLSSNGSTITISYTGAAEATYSFFRPFDEAVRVAGQIGQSSIYFFPIAPPTLTFDRVVMPVNYTNASNSSNSFFVSMNVGIYTQVAGSTSRLGTYMQTSGQWSTTNSGTVGNMSYWLGIRQLTIPWSTSLSAGNYWLAVLSRTTTTGGAGMTMSQFLASQIASANSGPIGVAPATSNAPWPGMGVFRAQTAALPATLAFTDIGATTSAQLRPPIVGFALGSA